MRANPLRGLTSWLIVAGAVIVVFALIILVLALRYRKVGPNEALIIAGGRKHAITLADGTKQKVGYRYRLGGGVFVWPGMEKVYVLPMDIIPVAIRTPEVLTSGGVPILAEAEAEEYRITALAKGKAVIVPTREEDGFRLTPETLKTSISPATKALILNNPSNPTGGAYTKDQLLALAEVLKGEDLYVIADETYASLVYDNFKFVSFAALGEEIKKKTIIINGVSKSYSMTGWRIGFAAGPAEVIDGMSKIQSHTTSNACSIAQKAGLEAYDGPQYEVQRMAAEFERRRNSCLMRLAAVPALSCFNPQGAFYLFPNVKSFYKKEAGGAKIRNPYGLAYYLLKEARVAIVPGDVFGNDDDIRLSYATSMANLEKSMDRIVEALGKLKTAKTVKRVALSDALTRVRKAVPVEIVADARMRDALVAEMEGRYEWNARIGGAVVQLRTNVAHLNDFWVENFPPAPGEADVRPHGVIYAVDGIAGREPRGFYHETTQTGVLVNTDLYASLRDLALGLAMDISMRSGGGASGAVRGMSADADGHGLILVGPPGTSKTELFFELLADRRFKLHSNEIAFVEIAGGRASAHAVERKLYVPTTAVELDPRLAPLFDRSKCENVAVRKEDCQDLECPRADDCRLERGSPYCYKAAKEARALLDPAWLGGPAAAVRRTDLRTLVLLRNDPTSPAVVELSKDEALRTLEAAGAKKALPPGKPQPFYNPHLLGGTPDKLEAQRAFFGRLLDTVRCVLFNSGVAGGGRPEGPPSAGPLRRSPPASRPR